MITEKEAKTKWCPFARVHQVDNVASTAINRKVDPTQRYDATGNVRPALMGAARCVGSECMAWRWQAGTFEEYGKLKTREDSGYIVEAKGYCGLAGKP